MRSRPHRPYVPSPHLPVPILVAVGVGLLAACDPPPEGAGPAGPARRGEAPSVAPSGAPAVEVPASPTGGGAIVHRVRFPDARNHYVDVESVFPTGGRASLEVLMAVWTPGSYLVREFSRNLDSVQATDAAGAALTVDKTRKNRWRVQTGGAPRVAVRYRVYAAEISVRTSWVSDDLAVLNGAGLFMAPAGDLAADHDIRFEPAPGWEASVTALPPHPDGQPHHYLAPDFDAVVDSPVLLGRPVVRDVVVGGARHRLAFAGDTSMWDAERAARDAARLFETQRDFFGDLPVRSYDLLDVLVEASSGNGLEHASSTLLTSSPWAMRRRKDYVRWLGLVSHEYFHVWNVKRLRPVELGPFDYENEVYTRSLWWAEGVTSYYDDLLVRRAGLTDRDEYLTALSSQMRDVESAPGRELQSVSAASFDAWIKHYRPDENSANAAIDYYDKGAVLGFLLDAQIRHATDGRHTLDDVMRAAYRRHAGERGYTPDELRQVAEETSGADLGRFWRDHVDGTAPLDYAPALDYFGLELARTPRPGGDEESAWLGLDTKQDAGRLRVGKVLRGGPAWTAGVQPGDELLAIDDRRLPPEGLDGPLGRYRPGARAELTIARWGVLRRIPVVLDSAPAVIDGLRILPGASAAQRTRLAAWLGPER